MAGALSHFPSVLLMALAAALPLSAAADKASTEQSAQALRALATWLESGDFEPELLAPLEKYGELVVPSLIAALEHGPSRATRELVRRTLEKEYGALTRAAPDRRVRAKPDFIQHYMANFDALYRARAAQALSAIGGPAARNALEASVGKDQRDDLRAALRQALEKVK
jgi:hypothetical protein